MLEFLRIQNLALIDDLELDLAPGLNVLTGETGAGKSFILKAINFLTGEKMTTDLVRPGTDKASAEAVFVLPEGEYILRRVLVAETGRSRLYVNDRLSSQDALKDIRPSLVLHTSQHAQSRLLQPAYQAQILDSFLPARDLLQAKDDLLAAMKSVLARKKELQDRSRDLEARRDLLEYQRQEIDKVGPEPGEEEDLLGRKQILAGLEKARASLDRALSTLHSPEAGLLDTLGRLTRDLQAVVETCPDLADDLAMVVDFRERASDLSSRLRRRNLADGGDDDPEAIEKRLFELAQLRRKLRRSLDEILSLKSEVDENLSFLDACGLDLMRLEKEEKRIATELGQVLQRLNTARREAAVGLKQALEGELKVLGFSEHVRVEFEFQPREVYPGLVEDRARVFWVPNPGQPPQPLDKIASGGELSRFLLATAGLMAQADLPTLIFDEVDAGVGGLTLNSVGQRIKELSRRQQVILITHWPQLASLADRHFQVRKEVRQGETFTLCHRLTGGDIVAELARMAGGGAKGEELARRLVTAEE